MKAEQRNIFRLLVRGQTNHFGNVIFDYANRLLISRHPVSAPFLMMLYQSSESLAHLIFNLLGGHAADFYNRKRILLVTDLVAALATFVLFLIYNPDNIWALILVNTLLAILYSFNSPAYRAVIRDLLSKTAIFQYNSLSKLIAEIVSVVSPLLALVVVSQLGFRYAMLINSFSFLVSAWCEYRFEILHKTESSKSKLGQGLKDGLVYIYKDKQIFYVLVTAALVNFLDAIYTFYLPFTPIFSGFDNIYAYILIAQSVGSILASLIVTWFGKRELGPNQYFYFLIIGSLAWIGLGFAGGSQLLILVLCGIFSGSVTIFNIFFMSHIQTSIQPNMLGRVFSIIFTMVGIFVPLGSMVASWINLQNWSVFMYIGVAQLILCFGVLKLFTKMAKN